MPVPSGTGSGIVLRRESGLPIYRQLVDQLRFLIGAGRYRAGEYLPTMRELAEELGLNLNTVNRAYRQLQRDGLIQSTPGKGARVALAVSPASDAPTPVPIAPDSDQVDAILAAAVERALSAGLTPKAVVERIDRIVAGLDARVPPPPTVAVWAGQPWRSRLLAARLGEVAGRDGVALSDSGEGQPPDLAVIPRFGRWLPDASAAPAAARTLELPVLPDRDAVRRLVSQEPNARYLVVAADAGVADWLRDAVAAYAAPAAVRVAVRDGLDGLAAGADQLVVETGLPGVEQGTDGAVIEVAAAFPASAAAEIERALMRNGPRA